MKLLKVAQQMPIQKQAMADNKMASYHLTVKVGKRGTGGSHADYVQRAGSYKNYHGGEDLIHTEAANIPSWAERDPSEFFRQSDLHERKNGSVYREFEIAIPREFSDLQRIEFVREFVTQEIGSKHPIVWALHNPTATISGGEQPHAHIMFSERTLDGIERAPEQFFRRANKATPGNGGCLKSNAFSGGLKSEERRTAIVGLRERFANLQNKHLEEHGHDTRVSHLSLTAQGIKRQPEKHLGPIASRNPENIVLLHEYRNASLSSELHQQLASTIDTTSSLAAALFEKDENERNRTAAFKRIRANLTTAGNHINQAESAFSSLERSGEVLAKAAANFQHHRAVREITQATFRQLGGAFKEVTRATERLIEISKWRELIAIEHQHCILEHSEKSAADERAELVAKYAAQGVVLQFDHFANAVTIGRIVEATNHYIVTNLGRDHYAVHGRSQFQSIEYIGLASGEDRFAIGNRATFKYNELAEKRSAIVEELRPERIIKNMQGNSICR